MLLLWDVHLNTDFYYIGFTILLGVKNSRQKPFQVNIVNGHSLIEMKKKIKRSHRVHISENIKTANMGTWAAYVN